MCDFGKNPNIDDLYSNACENVPRLENYTKSQVAKYVMTVEDYSDWLWNNHVGPLCPPPFHFYIQMGSYIESEMRGEVYGAYREVVKCEGVKDEWSCFTPMTRWDWRGLDNKHEDSDGKDFWVINIQELEANELSKADSDDFTEWVDYYLEHNKVPEGLTEWEVKELMERVEVERERVAA